MLNDICYQQARDELCAKVSQLGPFHLFFTLSCAEMNWSENFVTRLKKLHPEISVRYEKHNKPTWSGNDDDIYVKYGDQNEMRLWEFVESLHTSKYELLRDQVMDTTRIFDNRVKSFIKNILMGPGKDKIPISYYTYRVEFQGKYGKVVSYSTNQS